VSRRLFGEGRSRRASSGVFCLVLLGLTLAALGHVAVQAKKDEVAGLLGREHAVHEELQADLRHLEIEIGRLKHPERLVREAQGRLGMTPEPADIRRLRPSVPAGLVREAR
jgi:cell division protein FtsL